MLNIANAAKHFAQSITENSKRYVSFTSVCSINQKWREDRGLTANPNAFGPLTNLPDYTFLDGRPTPLGSNQKKRLKKQHEIVEKIVSMNKELKFAKERFARKQLEAEANRKEIMQNKLKPKGHLLLKDNN